MKRCRTTGVLSILGLLTSFQVAAFAAQLPDALSSVPADCPFIFGINAQQLTASPFFEKLRQEQPPTSPMRNELGKLEEMTGFRPARDISSILIAAHFVDKARPKAVLLLSGVFDGNRLAQYFRSSMSAIELDYGGASIWMIPATKTGGTASGITFLGTGDAAIGDMDSLKAVLDTRSGAKKSILKNPDMTPILNLIEFNDMLWIAINSSSVTNNMQIPHQFGFSRDHIQSIFGSMNLRDNLVGSITATAMDPGSALKIANVIKGLITYGQMSSNKNLDSRRILDGLIVSQNTTQITLSFNLPGDLIRKAGEAAIKKGIEVTALKAAPKSSSQTGERTNPLPNGVLEPKAAGVKPPVVLAQPLPYYTEEARRAKVEGKILLQLVVRKDGTPDSFKILQGLGHGLDESAMHTVANRWRFKPGTLDGKPVDVQILIEVSFRLYHKPQDSKKSPVK